MISEIEFLLDNATEANIITHLSTCDTDFVPPLSSRVEIKDYATKILRKATLFEAWSENKLVGLVAAYLNDNKSHIAYITSVSVLNGWTGKGIATSLISQCIQHAKALGMRQIGLEVASENISAIRFYERSGFHSNGVNAPFVTMSKNLNGNDKA